MCEKKKSDLCYLMEHCFNDWRSAVVAAAKCLDDDSCSCWVCIVCCGVLQCVAVCCSVLQCVAVCCSVVAVAAAKCLDDDSCSCSVLQGVAVCCSVLQCAAVCCSVLQCVAVCCSVLQRVATCRDVEFCICWLCTLFEGLI